MRTVGGAVGTQVAATVLAATLARDGAPTHHGFAIAFAIGAVMLALATLAALAAPRDSRARQRGRQPIPAHCAEQHS
jgi:hypothetical protein